MAASELFFFPITTRQASCATAARRFAKRNTLARSTTDKTVSQSRLHVYLRQYATDERAAAFGCELDLFFPSRLLLLALTRP